MIILPNHPLAVRGIKRKVPPEFKPVADMVQEWGAPCDTYEQGCPACEAWALFHKTGRMPSAKQVLSRTTKHRG